VALSAAEKVREFRESELKNEIFKELCRWFKQRISPERQLEWADRFKKLLWFPPDQPIPQEFFTSFRFWLMFDAPCFNRKRPVEVWSSTIRNAPQKERLARSFCESRFECYEIVETGAGSMVFRSMFSGREYKVRKRGDIPCAGLIFTRLLRIGSRYEIFGPYTSFVHEMRGEILVQLEKYNHEEERQEFAWDKGWKVFGWSIRRAEEMEQAKSASTVMAEPLKRSIVWPMMEPKEEDLPSRIMQQLEQFFVQHVAPLQKGTQTLYSRSLERLYKYFSMRYGQSFDWSLVDEEVLVHFLSVWYLDHGKVTPQGAKIFLNTLKYLFRWLEKEEITDVYRVYKNVYVALIRTLPLAVEMKKWLMENGVVETERREKEVDMYLFAVSSTGPVIRVDGKWQPVHLANTPSVGTEQRYWVRGSVHRNLTGYSFTHIEGVYPVVLLEKQIQVLGNK
jgi:hypothetical protein